MPSSKSSRDELPETITLCGFTYPLPRNEIDQLYFITALAMKADRENRSLKERMTAVEDKMSKLASLVQDRGACEGTDFHRDSGIALHDEFVTTSTNDASTQSNRLSAIAAALNQLASSSTTTLASTSSTGAPVLNVAIPKAGSLSDPPSPVAATEESIPAVQGRAVQKIASLFTDEDQASFPAGPVNFPGFMMPSACMAVPKEAVMEGMATNLDRERVLMNTPAKGWISMADMEMIVKKGIFMKEGGKIVAQKAVEKVPAPALSEKGKEVDGKQKKWKSWMKKRSTE